DAGGDAVILADVSTDQDKPSLATADNLTAYLQEKYGVSFEKDLILDSKPVFDSPLTIVTNDIPTDTSVTQAFAGVRNSSMIFDVPHPIKIAETLPENVTVSTLVRAGDTTYSKTIDQLIAGDNTQADADPKGPFTLGVMAENATTGSRVVLIGSKSVAGNQYAQFLSVNVIDVQFALSSVVWATKFDEFFATLPSDLQRESRPQDAPIFASASTLTAINLITVLILPFGTLALGIYVWWTRRARAAKES
ncbi:MAG TPA: hypothetical protein VHL11_04765, partial [Phototrophicaceae bacterium]|nr:hypothetical protein [Phototrophicaceae bacterium]